MPLKLYVWDNVLTDWSDGIMFALAESPEHARAVLLQECSYIPSQDLEREPKVFETPVARAIWGGG